MISSSKCRPNYLSERRTVLSKRIILILIVLVLLIAFSSQLFAATRTYRRSWKIYNAPSGDYPFAMVVGEMMLHVDADATIPRIYDIWTTSSTKPGSSFTNTRTWTANLPNEVRANCSSTYNFGLPKLGILGYTQGFTISRSFRK